MNYHERQIDAKCITWRLLFKLLSASWSKTDTSLMSMTGQVLMTCDLARRYGLTDVDGTVIDVYAGVMVLPVMNKDT